MNLGETPEMMRHRSSDACSPCVKESDTPQPSVNLNPEDKKGMQMPREAGLCF